MNIYDLTLKDKKEELKSLLNERSNWMERKSSESFKSVLNDVKTLTLNDTQEITKLAENLITWRKGPFTIGEVQIDAEWRSDFKWNRLKDQLPNLEEKVILDIGCNNGHFMFEMAKANPKYVLGIDPVIQFFTQFQFINHFYKKKCLEFQMLGIEHLYFFENAFDVIFNMGILYHHQDQYGQLKSIYKSLKKGGTMILETIGIEGEDDVAIIPKERYANMKNVYFVPTLNALKNLMSRCKFKNIELISDHWDDVNEQRTTKWCHPGHKSYAQFLKTDSLTIEGYPAPKRFALKATK